MSLQIITEGDGTYCVIVDDETGQPLAYCSTDFANKLLDHPEVKALAEKEET